MSHFINENGGGDRSALKTRVAEPYKEHSAVVMQIAKNAAGEFAPHQKAVAALLPRLQKAQKGESIEFSEAEKAQLQSAAKAGEKLLALSGIFPAAIAEQLKTMLGLAKAAGSTSAATLASPNAEDSGEAELKGDKLIISAHIIFYGNKAGRKYCSKIVREIQTAYNEPSVTTEIDGKNYKVVFEFTFEVVPIKDIIEKIANNRDIKNNFVRLEESTEHSIMVGNSGFWSTNDDLGKSKTAPHEMGHGLGLKHPISGDLRGKGQPNIMSARGNFVDKEYQWDVNAKAGETGGTLNPYTRKVTEQDVLDIIKPLKFDKRGRANVGTMLNLVYDAHGNYAQAKK